MTNKGTKLEFRELNKQFGDVTALADINLTVEPGEILGVIGYSGAGKSTLIRMINGLEKPTSGQVLLDDTDIVGISERQLRGLRRNIGMIFQHFNLFHSRNAIRNVEYPLELAGMPKAKRRARAQELLEFVGLGDKAESFPEQLSGGQKQRVGIARALATEPTLLLADDIDLARGDLIAGSQRPAATREFDATVVGLTEKDIKPGQMLKLRYGSSLVKARIAAITRTLDLDGVSDVENPESVAMNDIAHITIQTQAELPVEDYAARGAVGNFLLIDQSSGNTLAAGFVGHRLR